MVILRNKLFSKKDREIVPSDIIEKAKSEGVIQEYKGKWRIISFKTNPPTFWPAEYSSKEKASGALRGYQASKH